MEDVKREELLEEEVLVLEADAEGTSKQASKEAGEQKTLANKKEKIIKRTAKQIAAMGIFTALAYVVSWFETPGLFGTEFLKLDVGSVFILLISFLLGPVQGVIVCMLKECLCLINTTSGGVGQLANFIVTGSYLLLPSILYKYRRNFKSVLIGLSGACVIATVAGLMANRWIIFPFYFGAGAAMQFANYWWAILCFNLLKAVSVGLITIFLYKRLSSFFKKWNI